MVPDLLHRMAVTQLCLGTQNGIVIALTPTRQTAWFHLAEFGPPFLSMYVSNLAPCWLYSEQERVQVTTAEMLSVIWQIQQ